MCLCYCAQRELVSSANIIGTSTFEEIGIVTYNKNNNGPSIELCDTSHLISYPLREMCQNTKFFLVRIFPHSD